MSVSDRLLEAAQNCDPRMGIHLPMKVIYEVYIIEEWLNSLLEKREDHYKSTQKMDRVKE